MREKHRRSRLAPRSPRVVYSNTDALILGHLRDNVALYLLVLALISGGVIIGALMTGSLGPDQVDDLAEYTLGFFQSLEGSEKPLSGRDIFTNSLVTNLKTLGFIFILGFTVVGMPVVAVMVIIRGFIVGFTVSFLIFLKGLMGVGLTLVSVLPQNLFFLSSLTLCSVNAFSYSLNVLASRRSPGVQMPRSSLLSYFLRGCLAVLLTVLGVAVESYVVPVFMRLLAPYL